MESIHPTESSDRMESSDPMESSELTESSDPMGASELSDPIDSNRASESSRSIRCAGSRRALAVEFQDGYAVAAVVGIGGSHASNPRKGCEVGADGLAQDAGAMAVQDEHGAARFS